MRTLPIVPNAGIKFKAKSFWRGSNVDSRGWFWFCQVNAAEEGYMSESDFAPQEIKKQQPPHIFYFRGGTELADIYPASAAFT